MQTSVRTLKAASYSSLLISPAYSAETLMFIYAVDRAIGACSLCSLLSLYTAQVPKYYSTLRCNGRQGFFPHTGRNGFLGQFKLKLKFPPLAPEFAVMLKLYFTSS